MSAVRPDARTFAERVVEVCGADSERASGWEVTEDPGGQPWVYARHEKSAAPPQGWKLHVSATVSSAPVVVERVLDELMRDPAAFKVSASPAALAALNQGQAGLSQVGKFVTVYPADDAQAVRLAVALDEATRGLSGPDVPSDKPLRPGSLVHYRYGGFDGRQVVTQLGEVLPAIESGGELVPDRRLSSYVAPEWAPDPFVAAGLAAELAPPARVLAGRYAVVATLSRTARGAIHLAVDVETPRRCVVKQASRNGMEAGGIDARDRLRDEARVLRLLSDPRFPRVLDLREDGDDHLLVLEDVEGETLERTVMAFASEGRHVPTERVVSWGRELASILTVVHEHGLVYGDLKSSNLVVSPEGGLRLLDLELAARRGDAPRYRFGTRGYSPPQQVNHAPPSVADDVYALGAVLFFAATCAEPYVAAHVHSLLERPLERLNPSVGPSISRVIARCLQRSPSRRYPSAAAVDAALARAARTAERTPAPFGGEALEATEDDARARAREVAQRLADTLRAYAERSRGDDGPLWRSTHPFGGPGCCHLNAGSAGPLLALAELVSVLGGEGRRRLLGEAARVLSNLSPLPGAQLAGLYVGEAGAGAALLRAGQVLGDRGLLTLAAERGRAVAPLPFTSPDVFHGTAGRVRFHLLLWDALGEADQLASAVRGGESLLEIAEQPAPGELCWRIPEGYDSMSGQVQLGYAHGAAGIGDVLLDLFDVTADSRFRDGAEGALRWIERQEQPALDDGSGAGWPVEEGGRQAPAFWCHGAAGIGRFLLHAAATGLDGAAPLAERAARSAARGARWAGPTQCHGLAGNIEFLLDVYRFTGDRVYLVEARSLARLLAAFAGEQDGLLVWPSEHPDVFSPDYMVGFAGVATCLLRLSDPETLPHLLGREGFARTAR